MSMMRNKLFHEFQTHLLEIYLDLIYNSEIYHAAILFHAEMLHYVIIKVSRWTLRTGPVLLTSPANVIVLLHEPASSEL